MQKTSIQLSTREKPISFDYSNNHQLLVVSSCNDLSYYHISSQSNYEYNNNDISFKNSTSGSPCHVIHYEQSNYIKQTKMQLGTDHLVASLKSSGSISIYDYNTKSIKPLIDFIPSSFYIDDMNWSPHSLQLLASTGSSNTINGMLNLWDIRTSIQPIQQYSLDESFCNQVEWCPYDSNLISIRCNNSYIMVIDVRMIGDSISIIDNNLSNNTSTSNKYDDYDVINMLNGNDNMIQSYAWDLHSESIFIIDNHGKLENHSIARNLQGKLGKISRNFHVKSSIPTKSETIVRMIPDPFGISFVVATNLYTPPPSYYNPYIKLSSMDPSSIYLSKIKNIFLHTDRPPHQSSFESSTSQSPTPSSSWWCQDDVASKDTGENSEVFTEIGRSHYANPLLDIKWMYPTQLQVINRAYMSSLHLLTLNTNSLMQIIHIFPSRSSSNNNPNIVEKDSMLYDLHRSYSTLTEPATSQILASSTTESNLSQLLPYNHHQKQTQQSNSKPSTHKYSIHTMKHAFGTSSYEENKTLSHHNSIISNTKSNDSSKRNSKSLHINHRTPTHMIVNTQQLSVVGPITFTSLIEEDIYAIEYGISHGYLEGFKISRVDQFARKIHLELLVPNIDSYTITNKNYTTNFTSFYRSEDLHSFYNNNVNQSSQINSTNNNNTNPKKHTNSLRTIELVIIFSIKFQLFWYPTFTTEDKTGLEFNMEAMNALLVELTNLCRSYTDKELSHKNTSTSEQYNKDLPFNNNNTNNNNNPYIHKKLNVLDRNETSGALGLNYSDSLLFQIIRYFRKKLFKLWESIIESNRLSLSYKNPHLIQNNNISNNNGIVSTSYDTKYNAVLVNSDEYNELTRHSNIVDPHAPYMKYIEVLAYKVPIPIVSAGIFNAQGQLICFGKAKLYLQFYSNKPLIINNNNNISNTDLMNGSSFNNEMDGGGISYHKSFANTLINKIINTTSSKHIGHSFTNKNNKVELTPTVSFHFYEDHINNNNNINNCNNNNDNDEEDESKVTSMNECLDHKVTHNINNTSLKIENESTHSLLKNVSLSQLSSNASNENTSTSSSTNTSNSSDDSDLEDEVEAEGYDCQFQFETEKKNKPIPQSRTNPAATIVPSVALPSVTPPVTSVVTSPTLVPVAVVVIETSDGDESVVTESKTAVSDLSSHSKRSQYSQSIHTATNNANKNTTTNNANNTNTTNNTNNSTIDIPVANMIQTHIVLVQSTATTTATTFVAPPPPESSPADIMNTSSAIIMQLKSPQDIYHDIDSVGSYFIGETDQYTDGTNRIHNNTNNIKSRLNQHQSVSSDNLSLQRNQILSIYKVAYTVELQLVYNYSIGEINSLKKKVSPNEDSNSITLLSNKSNSSIQARTRTRARSRSRSSSNSKIMQCSTSSSNTTNTTNNNLTNKSQILTNQEAHTRAKACRSNAQMIHKLRPNEIGLSQFWNMLGVVLDMFTISDSGALIDWDNSSLGCSLLFRLFLYLKDSWDLQTYATAICVIGGSEVFTKLLETAYKRHQDVLVKIKTKATIIKVFDVNALKREMDFVLYTYADILHRWNEHLYATEILKNINYQSFPSTATDLKLQIYDNKEYILCLKVTCINCEFEIISEYPTISNSNSNNNNTTISTTLVSDSKKNTTNNDTNNIVFFDLLWCQSCQDWAQRCVLCEMAVRGPVSICTKCGHGGHFNHMQRWFARSNVCASGCGCQCITIIDHYEDNDLYSHTSSGNNSMNDGRGEYYYYRRGGSGLGGDDAERGDILSVGNRTNNNNANMSDNNNSDGDVSEEDEDDYIEENAQAIYDSYFGSASSRPDYLEAIYNHSSDYMYRNWG